MEESIHESPHTSIFGGKLPPLMVTQNMQKDSIREKNNQTSMSSREIQGHYSSLCTMTQFDRCIIEALPCIVEYYSQCFGCRHYCKKSNLKFWKPSWNAKKLSYEYAMPTTLNFFSKCGMCVCARVHMHVQVYAKAQAPHTIFCNRKRNKSFLANNHNKEFL